MAADMEAYIGCKAFFRTRVDKLQHSAYIQGFDKDSGTITFYKVTIIETGKVFKGLQYFHSREIYDFDVTSEVNAGLRRISVADTKELYKNNENEKSFKGTKSLPGHLKKLVQLEPDTFLMREIVDKDIETTKDENGQYESKVPENCTLLDDCKSQLFKRAISHLKDCCVLGVAFEGIQLGRHGKLCWISISTKEHTMFFDFKTMGEDCLMAGLKDILQSPKIRKITHDCRLMSDLMHHQYKIKLVNVFDTQVAAAIIYKQQHKDILPRYVTSLPDCLRNLMQVSEDELHFPMVRDLMPETDEEVWSFRPAPSRVFSWMRQHSAYLVELQERQVQEMLLECTIGVDIYLDNMRDANDTDHKMRMTRQHMLPSTFSSIQTQMHALVEDRKRHKSRVPIKYMGASRSDGQGRLENCTGVSHPKIVVNHDTLWHKPMPNFVGHKSGQQKQFRKTANQEMGKETNSAASRNPGKSPQGKSSGISSNTSSSSCDQDSPLRQSPHPAAEPTLWDRVELPEAAEAVEPREATSARQHENSDAPLAAAAEKAEDNNNEGRNRLRRLLQEAGEKQSSSSTGNYVLRPAGESQLATSTRKKRSTFSTIKDYPDLAEKTLPLDHQAVEPSGFDFDIIPSQEQLTAKYRCRETASHSTVSGFVSAAPVVKKDGGFRIDHFTETVPPPAYQPQEQEYELSVSEALEAILPRVENEADLLNGVRAVSSHHSTSQATFGAKSEDRPRNNAVNGAASRSEPQAQAEGRDLNCISPPTPAGPTAAVVSSREEEASRAKMKTSVPPQPSLMGSGGKSLRAMLGLVESPQELTMKYFHRRDSKSS